MSDDPFLGTFFSINDPYGRADREDGVPQCRHQRAAESCVECYLDRQEARQEAAKEEVRSVSSTGGAKGVKLAQHSMIPPEALNSLAEHYGKGAGKYSPHNWRRGYEWSKSYDALQRHANAFWGGEDIDPETGSPHIIAVAWHAFCLYTFMNDHPSFDDRFKKEK